MQAVVSALSNWIVALEPAAAGRGPKGPKSDPMVLLPGFSALHDTAVLDTLSCAIIDYLDSPPRWHEFGQHALYSFLRHLCASMHLAVKLHTGQGIAEDFSMHYGFDALSTASGFPLPCITFTAYITSDKALLDMSFTRNGSRAHVCCD